RRTRADSDDKERCKCRQRSVNGLAARGTSTTTRTTSRSADVPTPSGGGRDTPLHANHRCDFFPVSRFDDVEACSRDWRTFISGKGTVLELIRANVTVPRGRFIFEDPPIHDLHRGLMSRVFTPRRVAALEKRMREFCAWALDPLAGRDGFHCA